jgi:hypothetical protein
MDPDRRLRVWGLLVESAGGASVRVDDVCAVAIATAQIDTAAVTVKLRATPREMLHATDRVAAQLEELALTVGEGPCADALAGSLSLVGDLMAPECLVRWPAFAPEAVRLGIRAVFALPLQIGAIRLGVLDLYRVEPGDLGYAQLADALALADIACAIVLDAAAHDGPPPHGHWPERANPHHVEVHQATGMVSMQLGVTAAVALVRLRAYAYAHDRRLRDVAGDVVARRMRFEPDSVG